MDIRYLTLASIALTAVVGIAPSAGAAPSGRPCGLPEGPPVYTSIEHPAITEIVPAVTAPGWRWQRVVPTVEHAYARTVVPAVRSVRWTRVVVVRESAYARTVVDRPFVPGTPEAGHEETRVVTPAVTVTRWEYVQQQTGRTRWEREGWNAGENGKGWSPTGATDVQVVTPEVTEQVWVVDRPAVPEVPEVSHVETTWVVDGAVPPAGAVATGGSREASSTPESRDLAPGVVPDGAGWTEGATTETTPAVVDVVWLRAGAAPALGYDATGATRAGAPAVETTSDASASPPDGAGWAALPDSVVELVVSPEHEMEVVPAWVEDFVVPGEPTTEPCAAAPAAPAAPVAPAAPDGAVAGEEVGTPATGADPVRPAAATGLPATGAPVAPWLVLLGAGGVLAGAVTVRAARR
ncbi:hypothetical protein ACIRN4_02945 [Pimelobacter simplex]|uniref:hypothetical protein n=1 Tax=Nocardioides simplex TaxID=2045 RepID=UPI0037F90066